MDSSMAGEGSLGKEPLHDPSVNILMQKIEELQVNKEKMEDRYQENMEQMALMMKLRCEELWKFQCFK